MALFSERQHAKEPWSLVWPLGGARIVSGRGSVATLDAGSDDARRADGFRIVDCVNACAGLPDPAVVPDLLAQRDDLLAALKAARDDLVWWSVRYAQEFKSIPSVNAAIAKVEGGAR